MFNVFLISRIKELCKFSSEAESERIVSGLCWMGLFSPQGAIVRGANLLDSLCGQLERDLRYKPGERDLVMLQHEFVVEWTDGTMVRDAHSVILSTFFDADDDSKDTITSTLELLGDPKGNSAMAKSVGVNCESQLNYCSTVILLSVYQVF
jgi:hypothetical protein